MVTLVTKPPIGLSTDTATGSILAARAAAQVGLSETGEHHRHHAVDDPQSGHGSHFVGILGTSKVNLQLAAGAGFGLFSDEFLSVASSNTVGITLLASLGACRSILQLQISLASAQLRQISQKTRQRSYSYASGFFAHLPR